jgi:hypothetical protein
VRVGNGGVGGRVGIGSVGAGVALGGCGGDGLSLGCSVGDGGRMMRIVALGVGDADDDAEGDGDPLVAPPIRGDTPISALTITIVARLPAIAASTRST